jgi:hypothetical protein
MRRVLPISPQQSKGTDASIVTASQLRTVLGVPFHFTVTVIWTK